MASESRSATSSGGRLRSLLVSGEVAAAVLLLCGAGLLLQTLLTLVGGDTGYRVGERVGADARLQRADRARIAAIRPPESLIQFYDDGRARRERAARGAPRRLGVEPAVRHERARAVGVRDRRRSAGRGARSTDRGVHGGRSRLLRDARPADRERARLHRRATRCAAPLVCLVNEAFVRRHFEGRNPIGARLSLISAGADQARADPRDCRRGAADQRRARCARGAAARSTCRWRSSRPATSTWWCSRRPARRRR